MITLKDAIVELYKDNHSNTGLTLRGEGDEFTDLSGVLLDDGSALKFTFDDVKKKKTSLQAEYQANEYQRDRAGAYPSITDVVVALAEKEEGDSTMWDDITAKRQAVKTKYKKG
jgi:hypothetical protein